MAKGPSSPLTPEQIRQVAANLSKPGGELGAEVAEWMESGNAPMVRSAQAALAVQPGETVVEVGPGSGLLTVPLAQRLGADGWLHLIEHAEDMAAAARKNLSGAGMPSLQIHAGDWATAPVEEASADAVIAVNVVYFVTDLEDFLITCRRWLCPGGRLVLGIRSLEIMKALPVTEHGFILRPLDVYLHACSGAGFVQVTAAYHPEPPAEDSEHVLDSIVLRALCP